jgi:hypothetical protein
LGSSGTRLFHEIELVTAWPQFSPDNHPPAQNSDSPHPRRGRHFLRPGGFGQTHRVCLRTHRCADLMRCPSTTPIPRAHASRRILSPGGAASLPPCTRPLPVHVRRSELPMGAGNVPCRCVARPRDSNGQPARRIKCSLSVLSTFRNDSSIQFVKLFGWPS